MVKPKGGRGQKAPYETTHMRVPVPIKEGVEELIEQYRESLLSEAVKRSPNNPLTSLDEAIEQARDIMKHKKSARQSMAKLLSVIYGVDVSI